MKFFVLFWIIHSREQNTEFKTLIKIFNYKMFNIYVMIKKKSYTHGE